MGAGAVSAGDGGAAPAGEPLALRLLTQLSRSDELRRVNLLARLRAELACQRAAQITVVGSAQRWLRGRSQVSAPEPRRPAPP
jgi:hypothetical protein